MRYNVISVKTGTIIMRTNDKQTALLLIALSPKPLQLVDTMQNETLLNGLA